MGLVTRFFFLKKKIIYICIFYNFLKGIFVIFSTEGTLQFF
jgi:hypothetical protein